MHWPSTLARGATGEAVMTLEMHSREPYGHGSRVAAAAASERRQGPRSNGGLRRGRPLLSLPAAIKFRHTNNEANIIMIFFIKLT